LTESQPVPADAVTASGSGLDPQISLQNAELQLPRVAKVRGLSEDKVRELVQQNTDRRNLGVFGDPGVNVLLLNLALDQQHL
jgi:K+-transporting ATPase ATPase C chain